MFEKDDESMIFPRIHYMYMNFDPITHNLFFKGYVENMNFPL